MSCLLRCPTHVYIAPLRATSRRVCHGRAALLDAPLMDAAMSMQSIPEIVVVPCADLQGTILQKTPCCGDLVSCTLPLPGLFRMHHLGIHLGICVRRYVDHAQGHWRTAWCALCVQGAGILLCAPHPLATALRSSPACSDAKPMRTCLPMHL
jgi:hypothetical protein